MSQYASSSASTPTRRATSGTPKTGWAATLVHLEVPTTARGYAALLTWAQQLDADGGLIGFAAQFLKPSRIAQIIPRGRPYDNVLVLR
ncbi:MAG: hypothetical protein ACREOY_13265 [Candidatus Dormibacteraceae bacterium]